MQLSDAKRERHPASLNRRSAAPRADDGRIATPFEIAVLLLGAARGRRPDSQLVGATNKMPEISLRPLVTSPFDTLLSSSAHQRGAPAFNVTVRRGVM